MALLLATLVLAACGAEPSASLELSSWTLVYDGRASELTLPAHPSLPPEPLRYRIETRVELRDDWRGRALSLSIAHMPARAELRVEGELLSPRRVVPAEGYRVAQPQVWEIPAALTEHGTLALALDIDHRWTQSAWLDAIPTLQPASQRSSFVRWAHAVNDVGAMVALVGLVQIGLLYLGVFVVDRRRWAYLWFAVQGITAAFYPLFVLGHSQAWLGHYDVNVLAVLLTVAPVVSLYFTHEHYALGPPSRLWLVPVAAAAVSSAVVRDPFWATLIVGKITVVSVALVVAYQLALCARLAWRRRPGALYLLSSWLFLGATAWVDLAAWFGLGELAWGARPACLGLSTFALLQSLLLSRDHIRSLIAADRLNADLDARVHALEERQAEIEQLNRELGRQIAERSRQLFTAMSLAGGAAMKPPQLERGAVVQERYRIDEEIASGGMGTVYRATRLDDGQPCALKIPHRATGRELARLAREAYASVQVQHENLVGVFDVDVSSDGYLFIVFEYVEGAPLSDFRKRYGDIGWALPILRQVAAGLEALHEAGVVHRDVKPDNILVAPDGAFAKIADFGVSRVRPSGDAMPESVGTAGDTTRSHAFRDMLVDIIRQAERGEVATAATRRLRAREATTLRAAGPSEERTQPTDPTPQGELSKSIKKTGPSIDEWLSAPDEVSGTPPYMPPEAAEAALDSLPAVDVFAFGVVAYRLLTRRYPFREPPVVAAIDGRSVEPASPLAALCPVIDPRLAGLVERSLSFRWQERPRAKELHATLRQLEAQQLAIASQSRPASRPA